MGKASTRSEYSKFSHLFGDEDAAREWLEKMRWNGEPYCPHCGSVGAYNLKARKESKKPVRPGVWKCSACRKQFTVTVGTIFESSRIPLSKWLYAIHLFCSAKKGISANQLSRTLGITYKSAWFMAHRIRHAMTKSPLAEKLSGIVEADETYVGGKISGHGLGPHAGGNKAVVFSVIERDGDARSFHVANSKATTLKPIIREQVEGTAVIMTDSMRSYIGLEREFAGHGVVDHTKKEYVRGILHTNFAESFFSLFKRGVVGTFHHVSKQHLQRYLEEFDFRWNRRHMSDAERIGDAIRATEGKRLMYRQSGNED
jgi:transposase-like protein